MDPTKFVVGIGASICLAVVGWIVYDNMPERPKPTPVVEKETEKPAEPALVVAEKPPEPMVAPVPAENAPDRRRFDYKGDAPGVLTLHDFRFKYSSFDAEYDASKTPGAVEVPGEDRFHFTRPGEFTIAGEDVLVATYSFLDKILCYISLRMPASSMDIVTEAMREKHGPPRVTDKLYIWESDESRIEIE